MLLLLLLLLFIWFRVVVAAAVVADLLQHSVDNIRPTVHVEPSSGGNDAASGVFWRIVFVLTLPSTYVAKLVLLLLLLFVSVCSTPQKARDSFFPLIYGKVTERT